MSGTQITVTIPSGRVEAAIKRAGKFEAWRIESLARDVLDAAIKREFKKQLKQLDLDVMTLINFVDWNKVVKERVEVWAFEE